MSKHSSNAYEYYFRLAAMNVVEHLARESNV